MLESELVQKLIPYEYGEQPKDKKYIKLNTNENPYTLSENIVYEMTKFDFDKFRRYSDPTNSKLKKAIVERFSDECKWLCEANLFIGNGSDEILAFCFAAFFDKKKPILMSDITYSFYPIYAQLWRKKIKIIQLKENFHFDFKSAIDQVDQVSGIIIANPNAPTGIQESKEDIVNLLKFYKGKPVIIDEAYVDFADYSTLELLNQFDNLIIVRTFSKSYALAGARCGFAFASERLIKALETIKNSFNSYTVNSYTEELASLAVKDKTWFMQTITEIKKEREFLYEKFKEFGFIPIKSDANFIFVDVSPIFSAQTLYNKLKEKHILVRYFNKEKISNFLRITIGTNEENRILLQAVADIIAEDSI